MLRNARSLILGEGLRARAIRGSGASLFNFGAQNALRLAANLVLTRLLFPEAFGLMALVTIVISAIQMVSDVGIRGAVISDARGEDRDFLHTAWTVQVLRGVLIWVIVCLISRPVAAFYEAPELAAMLPVAGLTAILNSLASPNTHLLARNIRLGRYTLIQIGSYMASLAVMILLAWWMRSVWALLIGTLVQPALIAVLSHILLPGDPARFRLERDALSRLFGYGRFIVFATVANFLITQGDRAILGKFVSLEMLAIYNIGYFLAAVPLLLGNSWIGSVIHPLYARKPPAESAENRRAIFRARYLVTLVLFAGAAILALASVPLIDLLYDPRYEAAGPVMALIAIGLLPRLITLSYMRLPLAAGRSGRFAVLTVMVALVQTVLMLLGVQTWGILGVALAPGLAAIVTYPLLVWIIWPFRGWDAVHDAVFTLLSALLTALVLWLHGPAISAFVAL